MIGKVTKGKAVYGALTYNMDKVEEKKAEILHIQKISGDLTGELNISSML